MIPPFLLQENGPKSRQNIIPVNVSDSLLEADFKPVAQGTRQDKLVYRGGAYNTLRTIPLW